MKKNVAVPLVFGVAVVVSALVLVLLTHNKDSLFWVSLAFLEFSLAVTAAITLSVTADTRFSFPFGISIVVFSCIYIVVVATIDLLFGWLLRVALAAFICIHLIALAAFVIIGVLLFLTKGSIARQNETAYAASYEQQLLLGEADRLKLLVQRLPTAVQRDAELQLTTLQEAIRYSDLIPDNSVADIDNRIRSKVFSMACEIDNLIDIQSEDITAIHMAVSDIQQLIAARNLQIRNGKIGI